MSTTTPSSTTSTSVPEEDNDLRRPQFGNRYLQSEDDVFKHNAWDNVEWDEEQESQAKMQVLKNSKVLLTEEECKKLEDDADFYWDSFYDIHQNRFFKDRHWLFTEFPELAPEAAKDTPERVQPSRNSNEEESSAASSAPDRIQTVERIFEIGCGVGNTILPILQYNIDPKLKIYGCDFSAKAIEILQQNPDFDKERCEVFVMDATTSDWSVKFEENSIDIITLIFVLSAIHPNKWSTVVKNCFKYLKPGGLILLRDYGRYDLAQLRFKAGKCLQENFYARGDGTRVYFFTQNELGDLFTNYGFQERQNLFDRRLQVNRGKMLKMYRSWVQTKFQKPL